MDLKKAIEERKKIIKAIQGGSLETALGYMNKRHVEKEGFSPEGQRVSFLASEEIPKASNESELADKRKGEE